MMNLTLPMINRVTFTIIFFMVISLTGCVSISLNKIVSVESAGQADYVSHKSGKGYVQVYRAGQILNTRRGIELKPGDEIQTSPYGSAAIKFREHGTVVLDANTRVRIGSLEVIFGKIFANVRGLFSTYGEDVTLGVEGTRFMFEVNTDRSSRAVVLEGVVRISSKQNKWAPVRVQRGNEFRSTPFDQGGRPHIFQANTKELREISRKFEQVTNAPEAGFCCRNGKVNQSLSNSCSGKFYTNYNSAERGCQQGWCCKNQKVTPSLHHKCYGKFYSNQKSAVDACKPPVEPKGWCCVRGRLSSKTRNECQGVFYTQASKAKEKCQILVY